MGEPAAVTGLFASEWGLPACRGIPGAGLPRGGGNEALVPVRCAAPARPTP